MLATVARMNMPSLTGQIHDKTIFTLLGSLPEPACLIDPDGALLYANAAFADKIGQAPHTPLPSNLFERPAALPGMATALHEQVERVLGSCKRIEFDEEYGGTRYRYIVTPELSVWGDVTRLIVVRYELRAAARAARPSRSREERNDEAPAPMTPGGSLVLLCQA